MVAPVHLSLNNHKVNSTAVHIAERIVVVVIEIVADIAVEAVVDIVDIEQSMVEYLLAYIELNFEKDIDPMFDSLHRMDLEKKNF